MEKKRGNNMVSNRTLKWTDVSSSEIEKNGFRLEASVFNVEVKKARNDIYNCIYPKVKIIGENGFINNAHYGGRLKRTYVPKSNKDVIGFLGSSEMLQINPKPEKFFPLSKSIESLRAKKGTILISRSGTIGNLTYVNETLSSFLISEHAIRLEPTKYGGYLYAYLKTHTGQLLIQSNVYGAVISQIEPEHIGEIEIPNPHDNIKQKIHDKIVQSYRLRDDSNTLIKQAELILVRALDLPNFDELKPKYLPSSGSLKTYSILLSNLNNRLDASYHVPINDTIIDCLLDNSEKVLPLNDKNISKEIILPGRFKRHYVDEQYGTVFLGGKQIYELDPSNKKYLSIKKHGSRIENQLFLKKNMIAVTCSGTIGKVNIIPKHWENWTMSQHVLRIVPSSRDIAGYIYIWLNTDYAKSLITSHTYGSVVDEIDDKQIGNVAIPILRDKGLMEQINTLALKANDLRSEAYYLEQEAIAMMNDVIFTIAKINTPQ